MIAIVLAAPLLLATLSACVSTARILRRTR